MVKQKRHEERHCRSKLQGIPRKFVTTYGEELSDVATLEIPNGRVWKVGLRKNNGEIWFYQGWSAFVENHSLRHGHFLVFRYDGNSRFHVLIFDCSASEINYPCNPSIDEHNPPLEESPDPPIMNNETEEEEDSVEILGSSSTLLTKTKKIHESESEMNFYQPSCKRTRNEVGIEGHNSNPIKRIRRTFDSNSHDGMESISVPSDSSGDEAHMSYPLKSSFTMGRQLRRIKDTKPKKTGQIIARSGSVRGCPWRPVTCQKKERGIHAAQNFTSEYPYFTVTMKPSYIHQNLMQVPSSFVKRYLTQKLNKLWHLTLRVSDGRTWTVNCSYDHLYSTIRMRDGDGDGDGWGAFVLNNSLKEGDVCVFELIKMKNIELEVAIFRVGDVIDDRVIQRTESARSDLYVDQKEGKLVTSQEKEELLHATEAFTSQYPSFIVIVKPSHLRIKGFKLTVPSHFVQKYLTREPEKLQQLMLQDSDGRIWAVNYSYLYNRFRLRKGWSAFANGNGLKEGDVCVFRLIEKMNIKLDVTIFRGLNVTDQRVIEQTGSEGMPKPVPRRLHSNVFVTKRAVARKQKGRVIQAAEAFTSEYLFFTVEVRPSYVQKGLMTVPSDFVKRYLTQEAEKLQQLMLQDSNGRIWTVNYSYLYNRFRLHKGWSAFAHGNGLKDGDICFFRLIEKKTIKLDVTIFRGVTDQRMIEQSGSEESMRMAVPRGLHSSAFVTKRGVARKQRGRVIQAADAFTSKYPFFKVEVRPSYVQKEFMHVPTSFVKEYLIQKSEKLKHVTLRVSDGRMWTIECSYYDGGILKLCKGWGAVVQENQLKEGDACAFELIKMKNIVLEVTIFRAVEDNTCRVL